MTATACLHPEDENRHGLGWDRAEHSSRKKLPGQQSMVTKEARKRPRTASSFTSAQFQGKSRPFVHPPEPPRGFSDDDGISLINTRPQTSQWSSCGKESAQLPRIHHGERSPPKKMTPSLRQGSAFDQFAEEGADDEEHDQHARLGSDRRKKSNNREQLSKAARILEEDRKKVASIRSFLLNFLEDRDCSIKKRLDLYVHQTETGRPVTDTVVQEVCKLRPDMIGLSLRDCVEVTDVGLWCVARHTSCLRELSVSRCHNVTNIGLRSLAICCDRVEQLDFGGCTRLTDLGLRVIGGGCWDLRSLTLEGCSHVSDTGVAELAKMCTSLTYLNISHCERVGEYGDRALMQLGRSCHQLTGLDAFGCSHAQDPGLLAVARGCPKLEKLMLTGCGGITGKSVRALARGCVCLKDLSLSGCDGVGNGDLMELAKGCTRLRHLNIAQCAQVNARGLIALASGLKNLTELDVGGCERVDDAALRALCSMNAHFLNLSGCAAITESGVASIAMNCTALSSLNVTGCPSIGRRFMAELCHSMKLSEPAQAFFGFQPRKNAKELLAQTELRNRKIHEAIRMQAIMRGRLARGRANVVRKNWIIKTCLARAQAIVRGYFARKWYRAWKAQVREHRAAASVQATWRMLGDRRTAARLMAAKIFREKGHGLATKIQAGWWGHRGRARMREIRAVRARRLLMEARLQARREFSAITIQSTWRRFAAEKELRGLRRIRDEAIVEEKRRQAAAVLIQSVAKMLQGRAALAVRKAERDRKILEWEMALKLQAAWRSKQARMILTAIRIVWEERRRKAAAIVIQSFWRAVRARHLTKIQRAMFKVRQIQGGASKEIQRVYRGFKGRLRAKARKSVFLSDLKRDAAAMVMQRTFRGHKGRERFEYKQHLRALAGQARPLQLKLDELTEKAANFSERLRILDQVSEPLRAERTTLREELFHIRHTKDKYTDSNKINGCMQRFLTKFLKVRLVEVQAQIETRLEAMKVEAIELEVKERQNTRLLRQTERELIPLGRGTVEKVKLLRTSRLRKKARTEKSGATTLQRIYRGWRVRSALNSWYRDYWEESEDKATGDVYYVNTWNQEVRWIKPLEIALFEDKMRGRPAAGFQSNGDEEDGERFDGGVDSISSRFSLRHQQLTENATLAAEEEAKLIHHLEATQGADAVNLAREWRFVSTDRRLVPAKCWYHAASCQYFWGDRPPLLPAQALQGRSTSDDVNGVGEDGLDGRNNGGAGTFEVGGALDFADRAEGEAWIKTQNGTLLSERSVTVRDIGPFGWKQLQTMPPSAGADDNSFHGVLHDSIATGLSPALPADVLSSNGVKEHEEPLADHGSVSRANGSHTCSQGLRSTSEEGSNVAAMPFPLSLSSFTYFRHPMSGEIRWCLSPRSALATPRTPCREAVRSDPAAYPEYQQYDDSDSLRLINDGDELTQSLGVDTSGTLSYSAENASDNEWEVVKDGDLVFYYNRKMGISSWEPPLEREHRSPD